MKYIRFVFCLIPFLLLWAISYLLPDSPVSEFRIFSRINCRRLALWLIGYEPIL